MRLVGAELLKVRTTSTWWILTLVTVPLWALAMLINYFSTSVTLSGGNTEGAPPAVAEQARAAAALANIGANIYTTGQFLGVMLVMILGALVVTNEFFHQTATTTFLTSPRRTPVILAKLAAAVLLGLVAWLVTTLLNLAVGALVLRSFDVGTLLDEPAVWRAIGLNAVAYAIWAVLGVGAGVLIRSQIGTTVTVTAVYLAGYLGANLLWGLLADRFGTWFDYIQVAVPPLASQLMISGTELPGSPPRWVGAAVLVGYALVTGVIGTLIVRRRDIS
jgi:ABC-type transport system involved in multi-copper enzyme maturation permease subunit